MSTQLAQTTKQPLTIRDQISGDKFKEAVAKALPKHLTPERFIRIAVTALTRTPKLAECDQASFFGALMKLAQFGLEPNGYHAHLIPFENRRRGVVECQLIIDYKGLSELAMRSGCLKQPPIAQIVCENDEFEWDKGRITKHKVDWRKPRGEPYAAYSIAVTKDDGEICDVMTLDEIEAIRGRSRAKDSGPWVTDTNEMRKKTVFRRLSKWLPLSPEFRDALDSDADSVETQRFNAAKVVVDTGPVFSAAIPTTTHVAEPPQESLEEAVAQEAPVKVAEKPVEPKQTQQDVVWATLQSSGVDFTDFQSWLITTDLAPNADTFASVSDLPEKLCKVLLADNAKQLGKCVTIYGRQA